MNNPKVHILFDFKESAWGGGNQFLKALKNELLRRNVYIEDIKQADIILFNSHHNIKVVLELKYKYPNKYFVHRVDGPVSLIRQNDKITDKIIILLNKAVADATIFQSKWSREECYKLGMKKNIFETTIINAPDSNIFFPKENKKPSAKTKLIANSWSSNRKKGFDIYKHLDENLDFGKYEMTFVGNSPFEFRNIKHIPAVKSEQLGDILREHDIFITASINDPCSNSLLEALHCGLPAVVRKSGGHPEIINQAGLTFNGENDVLEAIDKVAENYNYYRDRIDLPDIEDVAQRYYDFFIKISNNKKSKEISFISRILIKAKLFYYYLISKFQQINILICLMIF